MHKSCKYIYNSSYYISFKESMTTLVRTIPLLMSRPRIINFELMLVIKKGIYGVSNNEVVDKQYSNLEKQVGAQYGNASIITMLSNLPLEEIDFLHNRDYALDHFKKGVDFARRLPVGNRRVLTFHLNSLVSPEEFKGKMQEQWYEEFEKSGMGRSLGNANEYAKDHGVEILIESVPLPEFGDVEENDERTYRNVKFRDLRNPFYMYHDSYIWNEVKRLGLGICLDLCHNRTLLWEAFDKSSEVLFKVDSDNISERIEHSVQGISSREGYKELSYDVLSLNPRTDLVHLNDGAGKYTPKGGVFLEGVALGDGDIIEKREIINIINKRRIPFVFEINETDFANRPNTKKSIEYVLQAKQDDF